MPTITLPIVIARAACRDAAYARAQANRLTADAQADLLRAQMNPSWSASASAQRARDGSVDTQSRAALLQLQHTLLDFGARSAQWQSALQSLRASGESLKATALEVIAAAVQAYVQAAIATDQHRVQGEVVRTAEQTLRFVQARVDGGVGVPTDALQARTSLVQAQIELARLHAAMQSARGALASMIGMDPGQALELASPVEALSSDSKDGKRDEDWSSADALMAEAEAARPEIHAAQARVASARLRGDALQAERWGAVVVNGGIGPSYRSTEGVAAPGGMMSRSVGITWTVPLLDGALRDARQRDVQAAFLAEEVALEQARQTVRLQVWQALQRLLGERENLLGTQRLVTAALEALKMAQARYREGIGSFADVLSTQNAAASARLQHAQAGANLLQARVGVATALGRIGKTLGS